MKAWRIDVLSHRVLRKSSMSPAELGNILVSYKLKHGTLLCLMRDLVFVAFPQNLCWMQALQQTESVLWWGPRVERSQGLPTSQPAGRHPPGPSSQGRRGSCQDWRCKMEVAAEGSHVVAGQGGFRTWGGAAHPRKAGDYQVWTSCPRQTTWMIR